MIHDLFIQLPGSTSFEVINTAGPRVGNLKDAIIAKFKQRFSDVDPDQLKLYKEGSSRTPLDPTNTMSEADIFTGTKLLVEVTAAAQAPLAGVWEELVASWVVSLLRMCEGQGKWKVVPRKLLPFFGRPWG